MLREMLLETQPWVLVVTCIVSILHTVFEFLAFRNNVSFWRIPAYHCIVSGHKRRVREWAELSSPHNAIVSGPRGDRVPMTLRARWTGEF